MLLLKSSYKRFAYPNEIWLNDLFLLIAVKEMSLMDLAIRGGYIEKQ